MRLVIIGPGRAGMSVALAAHRAGIEIAAMGGRGDIRARAARVAAPIIEISEPLPRADLVIVSVRDDAIRPVSDRLDTSDPVVHMSGVAGLDVLAAHARTGSFHPLQTLPAPEVGADRLAGSHVAIDATDAELATLLDNLATLLGMKPFRVAPELRPAYHAAAAAASNFVVTALAIAWELFEAAGLDARVGEPLTRTVVANAYELGPVAALTGPVARGDVATVAAHLTAVEEVAPAILDAFQAFVAETARLAGRTEDFADILS